MTPIYCYQWCLAHIHFIRVSPQKLRCTCPHVRLLFILVPNIYIYKSERILLCHYGINSF